MKFQSLMILLGYMISFNVLIYFEILKLRKKYKINVKVLSESLSQSYTQYSTIEDVEYIWEQ